MDPRELGTKIKQARDEIGLSQEKLGRLMNRSHAAISDIERGKTKLSISDLTQIARFLGKDISYFLESMPSAIYRRGQQTESESTKQELRSAIEDFRRYARLMAEKEKPERQ